MNKIVILGSSGLLGLNICLLLKNKFKIYPVINKKKIKINKIKTYHLNISSQNEIKKFLKKIKPQFLINCVALSDVEKCEQNTKLTYKINSTLASNTARICNELSIHYTFISSDHLYSGKKKFYKENDNVYPLNNYAKSKILAEKNIMKNSNNYLIIRTNFFGFGPSFRQSFLDKIFKNFKNKEPITLFSDVFYSPIYLKQLIKIIEILLKKNIKGVFNIVGNNRLTKYQFGNKIADKFNFEKKLLQKLYLKETVQKVLRPKDMSLSNKKIKKIISDNSFFDLRNGMIQLYKDYNSNYYKEIKSIK